MIAPNDFTVERFPGLMDGTEEVRLSLWLRASELVDERFGNKEELAATAEARLRKKAMGHIYGDLSHELNLLRVTVQQHAGMGANYSAIDKAFAAVMDMIEG